MNDVEILLQAHLEEVVRRKRAELALAEALRALEELKKTLEKDEKKDGEV